MKFYIKNSKIMIIYYTNQSTDKKSEYSKPALKKSKPKKMVRLKNTLSITWLFIYIVCLSFPYQSFIL